VKSAASPARTTIYLPSHPSSYRTTPSVPLTIHISSADFAVRSRVQFTIIYAPQHYWRISRYRISKSIQ